MKSVLAVISTVTLMLSACGHDSNELARTAGNSVGGDASAALATLFEEHFERHLELNPLYATRIGDDRFNDRLAIDMGAEYREHTRLLDEEYLSRLLDVDRASLDYQEQLSYDMFRLQRERSIEANLYPSHLQPVNQFYLMTNSFVQLGSGASVHPFQTVKDYDDFLSRTDDFVLNIDLAIENMKEGMQQGIVQPRALMIKVIPQIDSQLFENVEKSAFWRPIADMPGDFSAEDRARLQKAYRESIEDKVWPAFERLSNFISDEYLAASRETFGLGDLPDGDEWYRYMVKLRTTTDLEPDVIHQIGVGEVARIHDEMRKVMQEVGFEGDLKAFFDFVNTDDQFFFDEPEQLIQGYRDMSARIEELAKRVFDIAPKTAFEVRRVEPFREASASGGSYRRGTPDGSRPGVFYANAYDIRARPKWAMESLFLHEAIPGHHFQIALQQENENLPSFRRFSRFTAYSEGWGLYAESLGREIGVYTGPYQYFGALNAELWRAIRLVADTGIHAKGWTRQEVLDYMYANSAVAPARAISEAERFMAIPGQALSYKIGQLKIQEIRDDAEARLGAKFDVVPFHRQILKDGPMPLSMLEAKLSRWVDSQL